MKKAASDNLTPEQRAETHALAALPDNQINARHCQNSENGAMQVAALCSDRRRQPDVQGPLPQFKTTSPPAELVSTL
jgi:hypothetical protein